MGSSERVAWNTYATKCQRRELRSVLCDDLGRGGGGRGVGREALEGSDTCIHIADSCSGIAETNTTLQSNYPPIKNQQKKTNIPMKELGYENTRLHNSRLCWYREQMLKLRLNLMARPNPWQIFIGGFRELKNLILG